MKAGTVLAFLILLGNWAVVVGFMVPRLGTVQFLRLHYTASQGVDWVAPWPAIFVFPVIGLLAFFVDLVIAVRAARVSRPLGAMTVGALLLVEAFLAVGGVLAVLLNS